MTDTLAPVEPAPPARAAPPLPEPPAWLLVPVFALAAFLMTFRSVQFDSHVVGNSGDPLLIMWILGWVQHAIPHGWGELWNTSMFSPHTNTLAYSDSMLSVAVAEWPLRAVFGEVLGFNLLALAAQTASLWCMYRLALFLSRSWVASVVAAFGFLFATPLMTHLAHYQLTLTAFLVPLSVLLLLRYLETWRLRYGIGLGLSFAALTTSATYFGLMMASALPVVFVGYVLWYRPKPVWPFLRGLVAGGALAVVITLPVAAQYLQLQDDSYFRRGFDPAVATHLGDLLSPMDENIVLTEVWPFEEFSFDRSGENRLFPGLVVTGFGIAGIVVLVRGLGRGRTPDDGDVDAAAPPATGPPPVDARWRHRLGLLVMGGGLVTLLLSFGDEVTIAGADVPLPFKVLRNFGPGFSGIRATSRFVVLTTCALSVCAAFAIAALLRRRSRVVAAGALVVLCGFVFLETAVTIPLVRVPDGRVADGVADYLDDRPAGVVAELPIRGPADGAAWAYLESPRQLVSLGDADDRVNGYSGYAPEGFDAIVPVLNEFPSADALAVLDEHDVRYVVLRTRVLGDQLPIFADLLGQDGYGRFTPATARERIARIPEERVRRVQRVPGAYVVELRPPPGVDDRSDQPPRTSLPSTDR
jgi:hypothetical protein